MSLRQSCVRLLPILCLVSCLCSQAQEKVIYGFNGSPDGSDPVGDLVRDAAGNLYGATNSGGSVNSPEGTYGTVFELSPAAGGTWTEKVLYSFGGTTNDGIEPYAGLILDASGNLYGTTLLGGANGKGTVYELSPGAGGAWTEKVLYSFGASANDASEPSGRLVFDGKGNLYGTTRSGGPYTVNNGAGLGTGGTVFELSPATGGVWTEKVLYSFGVTSTDGANPLANVIFDGAGNLYGATAYGGAYNSGTVFELALNANGSRTESILHSFNLNFVDGTLPESDLVMDAQGNIFGTCYGGGSADPYYGGAGAVFELSPLPNGVWSEQVLHSFNDVITDGNFPLGGMAFDGAGNLYGATFDRLYGYGVIYQLAPQADGSWNETVLYNFGANPDGQMPSGTPIFDPSGNLYGTTTTGGPNGLGIAGTVWEMPGLTTASPKFSPAAGAFASSQSVTLSDTTAGAAIYYTTDGSTPTASSARYTQPIEVAASETLKAIAIAPALPQSQVSLAGYQIGEVAAAPQFSPLPGTYNLPQAVALSTAAPGAAIYYTTNGTAPTTASTKYSGPFSVIKTTTVEAIAVATGYSDSPISTGVYTIQGPPAATPVLSLAAGTYDSTQTLTITDSTPASSIFYTTNGTAPTTSSTKYTGPITVSKTETVTTIANATGYSTSSPASAVYTITPPAATPVFSIKAGTYNAAQTVAITDATAGASIYYTTDGSTPTTASTKYTAAINVAANETLMAIADAPPLYSPSAVASAVYTITPPAPTPTFSVAAGTYTTTQTVAIADSAAGATIYYTTNGTAPTTASTKYTAAITIAATETLEAVAIAPGDSLSAVATAKYTIVPIAATPVFSVAAGTYTTAQSVKITDATAGAILYYTTNGTTPTTASTKYTAAISVAANETLKAIAVAAGYTNSAVASAAYVITPPAATPVFSIKAGTYNAAQTVAITDATAGASIYYTTDGSTPTTASTKYTAAINVAANETLMAIADAPPLYSPSAVASAVYTITPPAPTPTFSVAAGTYTTTQTVAIADSAAGATIYYTTNGTAPTTASTKYTAAITIAATETLEAVAIAPGDSLSAVATAKYTIVPIAATPVFSVAAGTYTTAQSVKITDATAGAILYYTTNGTTPTTASTKYTAAISVAANETLKAIAVAAGYTNSAVASAAYVIAPYAATPVITPAAGTYNSVESVTIADSTPGAKIYYTTNGSAPTAASSLYSGPITVFTSQTVQAVAVASGYTDSAVASSAYQIVGSPSALAAPATNIASTTATINGYVNTLGLAGSSNLLLGTSATSLTTQTSKVALSASTETFVISANFTGLTANTTYYYQVVVTTAGGTSYSAVSSFTTN